VGRGGSRRWTAATVAERRPGGELCASGRRGSRGAEGAQRKKGGEKVQGLMWKIEKIQGLPYKVKFPVDLKL
jgi:hypothetical protein